MIVKDLIEKLKEMPQEMNVNIFDWRKNLFVGGGDSVSDGITPVEHLEVVTHIDEDDVTHQWIAINYENDDYTDEPKPAECTSISCHFEEMFQNNDKQ